MNNRIPEDAYLCAPSDEGAEVVIFSVGGCFSGDVGVVVHGPFQHYFSYKSEKWVKKDGKKKKKIITISGYSRPNWLVFVPKFGREFFFMEEELVFSTS